MSDELAIVANNLTKRYRMYKRPADVLLGAIARKPLHEDFLAVDDVTFSARKGEIVGIVGRNGAGKSTLLKMISGNLKPSSGSIRVDGSVAAILELGTGFHPEYTGRENVYIGGMCLGLTRAEVNAKIGEIIEFSELGPYIDRPFKTYSTGMQSRLTFATATSVDADILIVDEALSVGDARFQRRSFARMERYRDVGKTILLVSHDTNTVAEFCDRAILLEKGRVLDDSTDAKKVVRKYHELLFGADAGASARAAPSDENSQNGHDENPSSGETPALSLKEGERLSDYYGGGLLSQHGVGNARASIIDAAILNENGTPEKVLETGRRYTFWMRVRANEACDEIIPGFVVKSKKGVDLYGFDSSWARMKGPAGLKAGEICEVRLRIQNNLANGDYFLTVAIADPESRKHDLHYDLVQFAVIGTENAFATSVVNLNGEFSWQRV